MPTDEVAETENDLRPESAGRGKKESHGVLAGGFEDGKGVAGALRHANSILWRAFCGMPPPQELKALLERVFSGRGLYLYVH